MKAMDLTCPNCTAKIRITSRGSRYAVCEYCDSRYILEGEHLRYDDSPEITEAPVEKPLEDEIPARPKVKKRQRPEAAEKPDLSLNNDMTWNEHVMEEAYRKKRRMKLAILFICIFLGYGIGRESSPAFVVLLLSVLSIFIVKSISKDDRELEVGRKYYRGNVPRVSDKSRVVAFSLCLFLGYLGIHCFYSGKIAKGILYIFTFGLFGFGWLYDLIQIVLGKSTDRSGARLI